MLSEVLKGARPKANATVYIWLPIQWVFKYYSEYMFCVLAFFAGGINLGLKQVLLLGF